MPRLLQKVLGRSTGKKKMENMVALADNRGVNIKMTSAIKGFWHSLNQIEVLLYDWHYSNYDKEIYWDHKGVYEAQVAYSPQPALQPTHQTTFYSNHHLKVPPTDTVRAEVRIEEGYFSLIKIYDTWIIWREVTDPKEIETIVLQQNKRHLQQASIEEGCVHDPIMLKLIENHGNNDLIECLLRGEMTLDEVTD